MTDSDVLRALPYDFRVLLLESAWLSSYMTMSALLPEVAEEMADQAAEAIAAHFDEVAA